MPTIDPQDVPSNADKFVSDTWTIVTTPTKKTPKEPVKKLRVYWLGGAGSGNFGHVGRPGEVGGSGEGGAGVIARERQRRGPLPDTGPDVPSAAFRREVGTTAVEMATEPRPKTMPDAERRIRDEPNEHGFLWKDGQAVYFGNDKKDYIILPQPPNLRQQQVGDTDDPFFDGVFTHNHPSGNAFSPDDAYVGAVHNMKEIRAVVPGGAYSLRRVGKEWPAVGRLQKIVEEKTEEVRVEFTTKIGTGEMTVKQANAAHWKTIWPRVVRELESITAPDEPRIAFSFEPEES